jgi:cytoskeletal protein CcmA (bactofilin family)
MWNRDRSSRSALDKLLTSAPAAAPATAPAAASKAQEFRPEPARPIEPAQATALPQPVPAVKSSVLGPTLKFKGDLVADEDLVVQGHVEGSILHSRGITIGQDGTMLGDIRARRVTVEGGVEGDLYALDAVSIRATADVFGSVYAPRVGVTEGAIFNGEIDMKHAPAIPQPVAAPAATEAEMTSSQVDEVLTSSTGTEF